MNTLSLLLILALVQGATEFLPISSSGHLSLAQHFFGVENPKALDIFLHFPTFFAVLLFFRKEISQTIRGIIQRNAPDLKLFSFLIVSTAITTVFVFTFKTQIDSSFASLRQTGIEFLITSAVLFASKFIKSKTERNMNVYIAALVGLAQGIAVFPAISRSGMTISALLMCGISPKTAGFYSMMLLLPTIMGALILERHELAGMSYPLFDLGVSFIVCFVVCLLFLNLLMKTLQRGNFYYYGAWTLLMAGICFYVS